METSGCYYCVQVCSYQEWQRATTAAQGPQERQGEGESQVVEVGEGHGDVGKDTEESFNCPTGLQCNR